MFYISMCQTKKHNKLIKWTKWLWKCEKPNTFLTVMMTFGLLCSQRNWVLDIIQWGSTYACESVFFLFKTSEWFVRSNIELFWFWIMLKLFSLPVWSPFNSHLRMRVAQVSSWWQQMTALFVPAETSVRRLTANKQPHWLEKSYEQPCLEKPWTTSRR